MIFVSLAYSNAEKSAPTGVSSSCACRRALRLHDGPVNGKWRRLFGMTSQSLYLRHSLAKELKEIDEQEIWVAGTCVLTLRRSCDLLYLQARPSVRCAPTRRTNNTNVPYTLFFKRNLSRISSNLFGLSLLHFYEYRLLLLLMLMVYI